MKRKVAVKQFFLIWLVITVALTYFVSLAAIWILFGPIIAIATLALTFLVCLWFTYKLYNELPQIL